jgi:hypothetical protein
VDFERLDAVITEDFGLGIHAQHEWDIGAVDIGIEESYAMAELRQRYRQVYRERGLADASLAGADGYDGAYAWKGRGSWLLLTLMRMRVGCHGVSFQSKTQSFTRLYRRAECVGLAPLIVVLKTVGLRTGNETYNQAVDEKRAIHKDLPRLSGGTRLRHARAVRG